MTRLNFILLAVLTLCALALVTSQHKARKSFAALEHEQTRAKQIDIEWGKLQIEQSTWAMHTRISRLARERLHMRQADQNHIEVLDMESLR